MSELTVDRTGDADGPASRRAGFATKSSAFACALAVVTYIQRIGFAVGAPEIARDLGLDQAQVGYLMSAFLVAYGCFQVPGGLAGRPARGPARAHDPGAGLVAA